MTRQSNASRERSIDHPHDQMNFELASERLRTIVDTLASGEPLADIGTDHALIPIAAVLLADAPRAIGIDRAAEALEGGAEHVAEYGMERRVDLRLGEGLSPLVEEDEVRTVVMSGVGAKTMLDVMETSRLEQLGVERLVLQPNRSEIVARREILQRPDWVLSDESLVEENDYFYVVFTVDLEPGTPGVDLDDIALEDQLLGRWSDDNKKSRRYAAYLARLLSDHLQGSDMDRMPEHVRRRLNERLQLFREASGA